MRIAIAPFVVCLILASSTAVVAQEPAVRLRSDPPVIESSWDDLLDGVKNLEDWKAHKEVLRAWDLFPRGLR